MCLLYSWLHRIIPLNLLYLKMKIEKKFFGKSKSEVEIFLFKITLESGAFVELTNFGATIISVVVPDKNGNFSNVLLRYENIEGYQKDTSYIGSTVGRFANRIGKANFLLNGTECNLDKNDGQNTNHGGFSGFNSKVFDYEIQEDRIIFSSFSEDGEGGFPGNIKFSVEYSFSNDNTLTIDYNIVSDKDTVFNPTNHAYFNLSGVEGNILDHELRIYSDSYLETNKEFIPTGEIIPIRANTAFDFRHFKEIATMMPLKDEIIQGFNTYFISNSNESTKHLATLKNEISGRILDVYSTMPGVQIYTGDYLSDPFFPFAGICLEAQFYPDGPNHSNFETLILEKNKVYNEQIVYKFSIDAN